jgi:hypothetical protein
VTSGQLRILPMLQLLLTRTNQSNVAVGSVQVWCGARGRVGGYVAKYCSEQEIWLCVGRVGWKINSNHTKILTFQLKRIRIIK